MMRWVLLLLAGPAFAQSAPEMSLGECRSSLAMIREATPGVGGQRRTPSLQPGGWCSLRDMEIDLDGDGTIRVTDMRWRMGDFDRLDRGLPPTSISVEARGISFVPQVDDAVISYLMGVQFGQSDTRAFLDATWDPVEQRIHLTQAKVVFDAENSLSVTANIRDVDLSDLAKLRMSAGRMALTDLSLRVETQGLFEEFFAFPVGAALLADSEDPEADVERMKAMALDAVAAVPASILDQSSAAAMNDLITDLPHPKGGISLQMHSDDGLGALRFAPFALMGSADNLDTLWSALSDVTISASYKQTAD